MSEIISFFGSLLKNRWPRQFSKLKWFALRLNHQMDFFNAKVRSSYFYCLVGFCFVSLLVHDLHLRQGACFSLGTPNIGSRGTKPGSMAAGVGHCFFLLTLHGHSVFPASERAGQQSSEKHTLVFCHKGNAVLIMKRFQLTPDLVKPLNFFQPHCP